jgi:GNAT superfamily N-acetyltransferase
LSKFSTPRALSPSDRVGEFDCGEMSLNDWLNSRALKNEQTGASRTFVSLDVSALIAGYYCLSASALSLEESPGRVKRNMPAPIPVILIARLAVDSRFKGAGLGASLLQDAVLKGLEASRIVGARAFVVHALNDSAEGFYRKFGFQLMPPTSKRAMNLLIADAVETVTQLS